MIWRSEYRIFGILCSLGTLAYSASAQGPWNSTSEEGLQRFNAWARDAQLGRRALLQGPAMDMPVCAGPGQTSTFGTANGVSFQNQCTSPNYVTSFTLSQSSSSSSPSGYLTVIQAACSDGTTLSKSSSFQRNSVGTANAPTGGFNTATVRSPASGSPRYIGSLSIGGVTAGSIGDSTTTTGTLTAPSGTRFTGFGGTAGNQYFYSLYFLYNCIIKND